MIATWSDKAGLSIRGAQDRKTPRLWTIKIMATAQDGAQERITIRPRQKLLVSDLCETMNDALFELAQAHGEIQDCSFTAVAR